MTKCQQYHNILNIDEELRKIYLFKDLSEKQLVELKQYMRYSHIKEGEYLFKCGQQAERFFLLQEGHIKLTRISKEGAEKVFEVVSPGQTFAEAAMFMPNSSYPMTAQAIDESAVLCFESQEFMKILKGSWDTTLRFMLQMSKRIRMWINEVDHLTLQNATYRLVNYILEQVPEENKNDCELKLSIPKQVIASRLSIKPETLSRILNDLSKEEFLTVKGPIIYINNVNKLRLHIISIGDVTTHKNIIY